MVNSKGMTAGGRLLADVAGGHLPVLLADGVDHVAGGHAHFGHLLRVEPQPHAVVLLAELHAVADAVHTGDLVLELDGGVVAQVELVVAALGGIEPDNEQDVRAALAGGDAGLLDDVGQKGQGQVDAVLHQHLGEVQIDAGAERGGQLVGAVVVRLRHHVHHVFDAVNLLLDGGGHRVGHELGVGARVGTGDDDARRGNLRILGEGQVEDGHRPRQGDDDGQDRREDRPFDEEM
jgi:hypothetical protein